MNAETNARDRWLQARLRLLEAEKAHLRQGDEIARMRRALPRLPVTTEYRFSAVDGTVTLTELFGAHSQLVIQHFMFGADYDAGCPSCSFWADGMNPMVVHLAQRDIAFALVSRGPIERIDAYRRRMGWTVPWVSSLENTFSVDFGVSASDEDVAAGRMRYNYRDRELGPRELHGYSVFQRDPDDGIFHTYSTYGRGVEPMNAAYALMDLTPKGRDEAGLPWPMAWLRRHDEYA